MMNREHKLQDIENEKLNSQKLKELIQVFRNIDDFEEDFYNIISCEDLYAFINKFICLSKNILRENEKLIDENNKIKNDSKSLRNYLSKISINQEEINYILRDIDKLYCERCGKEINMIIIGYDNKICYDCLNDLEKENLINNQINMKYETNSN